MFGFVYLFFGTQKETFPEFRDIAVADGIVENMIIIYGCDIFQGIASVFLLEVKKCRKHWCGVRRKKEKKHL